MWSVLQSNVNKVREKYENKKNHICRLYRSQLGRLRGLATWPFGWDTSPPPSTLSYTQSSTPSSGPMRIAVIDRLDRCLFQEIICEISLLSWSKCQHLLVIQDLKKVIFKIIVINQQSGSSGILRLKDKRFSAKLKILSSCQPFLASSARDMTVEARLRLTFTLSNTILGSTSMDQHVPTLSVHF